MKKKGFLMLTKRDRQKEEYNSDKMRNFLKSLKKGLAEVHLDENMLEGKIKKGISSNMTTKELIQYASETIAYMNILHPDYSKLAARVTMTGINKQTSSNILEYAKNINAFKDISGRDCTLLSKEAFKVFNDHAKELQELVDYKRDMDYDFFGLKTLEKSYLLRVNNEVAERPQQLLIRVAIGIHGDDFESIKETYELMSKRFFTHATPTLFNSGTPKPQMSSCFLLSMMSDSIDGIYKTLERCAHISKSAGGIGVSISCIRAKGSYIRGTNGISNGIVPMLRVYDSTARYVDQGGGKRKGSFAMYIEPWHADIFDFLNLKKNHGKEEMRARDLFYALWTPDLFMKRVSENGKWTLMCPAECPGLDNCYGKEFEELYEKYEKEGRGRKTIDARTLWFEIINTQIETGTPYMMYKDACNKKSNQQNLGTIKCSNLCTEIVEYTSPDEVAVCNLASIALPKCINLETKTFNFETLMKITKVATKNLNRIIDRNYYPVPEAKKSNLRHRPIGLGVQGLADTFAILKLNYDSPEALKLNNQIFETMYFAACTESMELAKESGPYETFKGSPASKGLLQFDLWNKEAKMYDWVELKKKIKKYGMRNSLLLAPMPTASTSQILGNNETFEAFTSNIYSRRVLSGEFICVNKHLIKELINLKIWDNAMRNKLLACNGSIQNIDIIPEKLKKLFRTVWEIPQKSIINLAIGRAPFIDQSQSLNIHLSNPDYKKISSMHMYGWKSGLKTGMYYLRSKPAVNAIKFSVDVETMMEVKLKNKKSNEEGDLLKKKTQPMVCKLRPKEFREDDDCLMCGS